MTSTVTSAASPPASPPRLSNERKFIGDGQKAALALALFDHLLLPDGEYPVNHISSVYYETPALRSFGEKADGDNLKHKVRLRWYSVTDAAAPLAQAFLEVKFRVGSARHKLRHDLSLERRWLETAPLTDPAWLAALQRASPDEVPWMTPDLLPAVCISYERHRYRCPYTNGRVAIDRFIRVDRFHPALFPLGVPLAIGQTVCEFKDAAQVDIPWARHLYEAGFRLRSFSKFGEAIRLLQLGGTPA